MIYFTLPNFLEKIKVNKFLQSLFINKPEILKVPVRITNFSGSFPYSIWNGSINNNYGKGWFYPELMNFISNMNFSLRLDVSNLLLQPENFYNTTENFIFQNLQNSNSQIEISNLQLLNYLKENYDNYYYVFSEKADLLQKLDLNLINTIVENQNISFLKLPKRFYDDNDILKNISISSKIEIIVNQMCPNSCNKYDSCILAENKAQLEFSRMSCFNFCDKTISPFSLLDYTIPIEKVKEYNDLYDINRFSFVDIPNLNNDLITLHYYLNYFVKPEFYSYAIDKWLKVGSNL